MHSLNFVSGIRPPRQSNPHGHVVKSVRFQPSTGGDWNLMKRAGRHSITAACCAEQAENWWSVQDFQYSGVKNLTRHVCIIRWWLRYCQQQTFNETFAAFTGNIPGDADRKAADKSRRQEINVEHGDEPGNEISDSPTWVRASRRALTVPLIFWPLHCTGS